MNCRMSGLRVMTITLAGALAMAAAAIGARPARAAAVLTADPAGPVEFGDQRVAMTSDTVTVTLTNTDTVTDADPIVCTIENDGGFHEAADFGYSACPTLLTPGETVDVDVTFTPISTGPRGAKLHVVYDDGTGTMTLDVSLRGNGVDGPDLVVNDDWSEVSLSARVGFSSAELPVPMENLSATYDLTISDYSLSDSHGGVDCDQFSFDVPSSISAATTSSFGVTFSPASPGIKRCTVQFASNDPDLPDSITISGTGTAATINLTPDPQNWGNVLVGSTVSRTLTVTNVNSATADTLNLTGMALGGTDPGQFAIASPTTFPINNMLPGATQPVVVNCHPNSIGPKAATLTVSSNAEIVTNNESDLNCTGVKPDAVVTPPPAYTFGDQQINTTSTTTRSFRVRAQNDTYSSPLWVKVVESSGNTAQFGLTTSAANSACLSASGCTLAPNAYADFTVTFRPTTIGAKSEVVRITTDDQDAAQQQIDYSFTGNGINPEIETTTGSPFEFGDVLIGSPENGTVTIRNAGTTSLAISSVILTTGNADDFAITAGTVGPSSLAPTVSANWTVRCNPSVEGLRTTRFRVASNDHDEDPLDITLNCHGTTPKLVVTPNPIAFPPTYDCTESAEMTVTLQNQGSAPLAITGISSGSSTFTITTPPAGYPVNLAALGGADSTSIGITFIPPGAASYSADLTITWDDGPTVVSMTGDGRVAAVTASPLNHDYGDIRIDGAPVSYTYTIENTGTHTFDIDLLELDNTTDFTLVDIDALGATLNPSDTVSFQVDALPLAVGGASGTVAVTTSLPDTCASVIEIDVDAAGVIPGIAVLPVDVVAFGPQDIKAVTPASQTLAITNSGTALLSVSDVVLTGDSQFTLASGQETSFEVGVGATNNVMIEYVPTMVENNVAILEVASDAAGGAPVSIDITGRGIDRELSLSATALDFPATYRNTDTPSTLDFDISNLGEATLNISTVEEGGAGAAAFALAANVPPTVAGGDTATVTVEFTPTAAGLFEAYLQLTNDDTDEGVARIDLSGLGRVPNIATPALPVDLGRIGIGVPTRLSDTGANLIQLVNRETDSFMVRELRLIDTAGDPVDPGAFRILDFTAGSELAGGATLALDVEVMAESEGDYEVTLEVYLDNDPLRVAVVTIRAQAVPVTLRGGGCQVGGNGGASTGLLLFLVVALLALTGRRRRLGVAALVVVVGLTGGVARADRTRNLDLTTFRPMPGIDNKMISVELPEVGESGAWFFGVFLDHAVNPLNLGAPGTEDTDATVSARTAAELAFSYALGGRYEVGALVPLLSQTGSASTVINGIEGADGTSLGDLSLHGKAFLWRAAPISLGGSATLTLPTAGDGEFAGVNGPTAHLRGIAGLHTQRVDFVVNAGVRLRGKGELADIRQGNELTYGFAASYQAMERLAAIAELYGAFSLAGGVTTGTSPLESAFGVRYRVSRELGVVVGAGRGVMAGIGVADVRGFLLLAYSSRAREIPQFERGTFEQPVDRGDRDGDGIINSDDNCPDQAEDVDDFNDQDGCPDPDNDGDGLLDGDDPCPNQAEDKDGFKDDDGCPDIDNDDDGVIDSKDKCPDEPEDKDGFEDRDGCDDPDNDKDGIPDVIDQCALEPETINGNKDDDGCPDPGDSLVMVMPDRIEAFEPVRFRGNSADLLKKSEKVLAQVAATLRANRDFLRIRIAVHVQPRSGNDLTLTKRRAEAVRKWLIGQGVEPERLETKGYGSSRLLVPKKSRGARNINDRVEFILLEKRVGDSPK